MLTRIDKYIITKFLGTFFFILALIMTISVVFDISEKLDDFLKINPSIKEVVMDYYLNFVLHYGILLSSLIIFIALIWFTSRMAQRSEIIAILTSGVSFNRLLLSFIMAAFILVSISLILTHYLVPNANKNRYNFERTYIDGPYRINEQDLHAEIEPGIIAYFKRIDYQNNWGSKFSIEHWNDGLLTQRLISNYARFDTVNNRWKLENYFIRTFDGENEKLKYGTKLDTVLELRFSDFGVSRHIIHTMTTPELNQFIVKEKLKGSDRIPFYQIEKYQRTSFPLATFILTLIGVVVASRKVRGGYGINIVKGILIAVLYIFAMKMSTVAATNVDFNPLLAVWTPNLIFSIIAIYLYIKAPK